MLRMLFASILVVASNANAREFYQAETTVSVQYSDFDHHQNINMEGLLRYSDDGKFAHFILHDPLDLNKTARFDVTLQDFRSLDSMYLPSGVMYISDEVVRKIFQFGFTYNTEYRDEVDAFIKQHNDFSTKSNDLRVQLWSNYQFHEDSIEAALHLIVDIKKQKAEPSNGADHE